MSCNFFHRKTIGKRKSFIWSASAKNTGPVCDLRNDVQEKITSRPYIRKGFTDRVCQLISAQLLILKSKNSIPYLDQIHWGIGLKGNSHSRTGKKSTPLMSSMSCPSDCNLIAFFIFEDIEAPGANMRGSRSPITNREVSFVTFS